MLTRLYLSGLDAGEVHDVHLFFRGDLQQRNGPSYRDGIIPVQDTSILRAQPAAQIEAKLV